MKSPSQRLFEGDLQSADFRSGVLKEHWGVAAVDWPRVILWVRAAPRAGAPDRYHVALDLEGYRAAAPTGSFWDPTSEAMLDTARRPKGKEGSRFAKVFRTDWEEGKAFYHPYDRVAADSHPKLANAATAPRLDIGAHHRRLPGGDSFPPEFG